MNRYKRQELFDKIGKTGQIKISNSSISIIGVGALGSISSELLVRSGIKQLTIFDDDKVDITNLQRQGLYTEKDVGIKKVIALKSHLEKINSEVKIIAIDEKITKDNSSKIKSDIIIDGTDNMETRFLINNYAVKNKIPYIYGAAAGSIGIVYTVTNKSPCLECIFKNAKNFMTCENLGIINSTTHTVASLQVAKCLKLIVNDEKNVDELIRFDLWKNIFDNIKVKKDKDCKVCGESKINEESLDELFMIKECKTKSSFSAKPNKKVRLNFDKLKENFECLEDAGIILILRFDNEEVIVHNHGELVFKKLKDTNKIKALSSKIYSIGLN